MKDVKNLKRVMRVPIVKRMMKVMKVMRAPVVKRVKKVMKVKNAMKKIKVHIFKNLNACLPLSR